MLIVETNLLCFMDPARQNSPSDMQLYLSSLYLYIQRNTEVWRPSPTCIWWLTRTYANQLYTSEFVSDNFNI